MARRTSADGSASVKFSSLCCRDATLWQYETVSSASATLTDRICGVSMTHGHSLRASAARHRSQSASGMGLAQQHMVCAQASGGEASAAVQEGDYSEAVGSDLPQLKEGAGAARAHTSGCGVFVAI